VIGRLIGWAAAAAMLAPAAVLVAGLERAPAVGPRPPPSPADARRARELYRAFREATTSDARSLTVTAADLAAATAVAGRLAPGLRADAALDGEAVDVALAAPVPFTGGALWWNLRARAPASAEGLRLSALSLGPVPLPAGLAPRAAAAALDLVLGGGAGTIALKAIDGVTVADDAVTLSVAMTAEERRALAARAKGAARALTHAVDPAEVRRHLGALAAATGSGPLDGALAATARSAAEAAAQGGDATAAMKAALFALAIACGHRQFEFLAAQELSDAGRRAAEACDGRRLGGRIDLRRHFALSAGLHAAADSAPAYVLGEIKELLDASGGGSGFSFDDLAADRAGIRFAAVMLASPPARWPALAAALEAGEPLLPPLNGLASGLSAAAFARGYGDVDDPRYVALVEEIDRRLDALPFFAGDA
jgi:hypothetical protein